MDHGIMRYMVDMKSLVEQVSRTQWYVLVETEVETWIMV